MGIAPITGYIKPLNTLDAPSFWNACYVHCLSVNFFYAICIRIIIVSRGCPAIIPDVFAITEATKELNIDF